MNETIQELINSPNYEDVYLGVELLRRTESEQFFIHTKNSGYFLPRKLRIHITREFDGTIENNPHYIIKEYCRKNNYWIYE